MFRRGVARFLAVVLCVVAPGLMVLPSAAAEPVVEGVISFADVPESSLFYKEISWLAAEGISTGWDVGGGVREYRPLNSIARDAMAAFLYRKAGSPAYTPPASSPFIDVAPGAAFYKEITWLASKGISTGWDVGGGRREYRPLNPIARDAMAAFLFRFAEPGDFTAPAQSPFVDVASGGAFYREITWLASSGISTGWEIGGGAREYRPLNGIARDAMAAFLYRHASEKVPTNPLDPAAGTVTVAPDVEVLDAAQLDTALVSGGSLTLPSNEAAEIRPNDVLVAGVTPSTPEGLLARVAQVSRDPGGNTIVQLKPATLAEAIVSTSGLLEVAGTPVSSSFIPEPDVTVTTDQPDATPFSTWGQAQATTSGEVFSQSFSVKRIIKTEVSRKELSGDGSITLDSSIRTSARAKMTLEKDFLQLREASVVLTPTFTSRHSLGVSGTLEGTASAPLGILKAVIVFPTAIPVVVTAEAQIAVNVSAAGTADISYVTAHAVSSDMGFKYRDGSFALVNTKPQVSRVQNEVQATASLTARAGLDFDADVRFYGIAGITFGAGPYASAPIAVIISNEPYTWSCPLEIGFEGRLGVVAGIEVMGFKLENSDGVSASWALLEADPCQGTPVVAPAPKPAPSPAPAPSPDPGSGPSPMPVAGALEWVAPAGPMMPDEPSASADGRFVAFVSASPDLVPGDVNNDEDVFVRDMSTDKVALVSATPDGAAGSARSNEPTISADGRYVAFTSEAVDIAPEDTGNGRDVFIRDVMTGTTRLVSKTSAGNPGSGVSYGASISGDGRYVAFTSSASDLVATDANNNVDVFVRDMMLGTTRIASSTPTGVSGNGGASHPSISADGRFIAFGSNASNLVAYDVNAQSDVFVRDLTADTTSLVSTAFSGERSDMGSHGPSISGDGRYIAFSAGNGRDLANDVYVRDMHEGTTSLVSVDPVGASPDGFSSSGGPSISSDGQRVSFITMGMNMVTGENKGAEDVYVRDLQAGTTRLVSVTHQGKASDDWHARQSISSDGRWVVFSGSAAAFFEGATGVGIFRAYLG